jgi:hypothetical protein
MKKSNIGMGLVMLLLVSFCVFGFQSPKKVDATKVGLAAKPGNFAYIGAADLTNGGYYYYWDHGSGAMVAQYDRTENGVIYNYYSITPAQLLYEVNSTISLEDAGNIQAASLLQIAQLLRCILAGLYVL